MDILILIAFGAVLFFLIGGFSLGVGSVLSSALLGLSRWAKGPTYSSYTPPATHFPELPESLQGVPFEEMTRKQFKRYMRHVDENYMDMTREALLDIPVEKMSDAQFQRYKRYLDWHSPRPTLAEAKAAAMPAPEPPPLPAAPKEKPRYRLPVDISDLEHIPVADMTEAQYARYKRHVDQAQENWERYLRSLD